MVNNIEGNVMVNQVNDLPNLKHIDSDNTMNQQQKSIPHKEGHENSIDFFSLSDTSKQVEALKALLFDVPDINQAKVQFIKEELSAGRYEIQSTQIAAKMIADVEMA